MWDRFFLSPFLLSIDGWVAIRVMKLIKNGYVSKNIHCMLYFAITNFAIQFF